MSETESRAIAARTPLTAGAQVAAIIPHSLDEAWRMSQAFAASGMTPNGIKSAEQVMVVICGGAEVGFGPFQSLQSFAVINGKLTMWGDAIPALLYSHGFKVKEWVENEGTDFPDAMTAICEVTRPDGEVKRGTFSVAQAKRAKLWEKRGRDGQDTPWITYPDRMLKMRARAFAARDGAPDVLRGIAVREEAEDIETVTVVTETSAVPPALQADGPKPRRKKDTPDVPAPEADAQPEPETAENCANCDAAPGEPHADGCPQGGQAEPGSEADEAEVDPEPDGDEEAGEDGAEQDSGDTNDAAAPEAEGEPSFPPEMTRFIDKVEGSSTFGEVKGALQEFFATECFRAMPLLQQNRMRADTWDAVEEKKEAGQMLDLPDHAQDVSAFRLWLEAQPDAEAIRGTFEVLKKTPNYESKDAKFRDGFEGAVKAKLERMM